MLYFFKKLKLSSLLNLSFYLVLIVPLILIFAFCSFYLNLKIQDGSIDKISREASYANLILDNATNEVLASAKSYAQKKTLAVLLSLDKKHLDPILSIKLADDLSQLMQKDGIDMLTIVDALSAKVIVRAHFMDNNNSDFHNKDFIERAILGESFGFIEVLNRDELKDEGINSERCALFFTGVAPIYDRLQENIIAVLVARKFIDEKTGISRDISERTGSNVIISGRNRIVDYSGFLLNKLDSVKDISGSIENVLNTNKPIIVTKFESGGFIRKFMPLLDIKGQAVGVLLLQDDIDEYLTTRRNVFLLILLVFLFWVGLAQLLKKIIENRIVRPLFSLKQGTEKICAVIKEKNGSWTEFKVDYQDEIGELSSALNFMANSIKENEEKINNYNQQLIARMSEIAELNTTLEEKVEARTNELNYKNEELLQAHKETLDSEIRFRVLANASCEGVAIQDKDIIIDANMQLAQMFGFEKKELINKSAYELITPECHADIKIDIDPSQDSFYELNCLKKDGTVFPAKISVKTLPFKNKNCRVAVVRDISQEKKSAEEREKLLKELQEAKFQAERESMRVMAMTQDKLASLGLLATGVAHEINQPLTFLKIIFESCEKDILANKLCPDELAEDCGESLRQIGRITEIIDHLRTFGKDDGSVFVAVDMSTVISNTLILMRNRLRQRNITLKTEIADELPMVHGSLVKLEQVFINLIQNSVDALFEINNAEINIFIYFEDQYVKIDYKDSGNGISPEIAANIFEPFFSTKEVGKGTGLGLSIIYGIIQEHKGNIVCLPSSQGAHFLITLPVCKGLEVSKEV